MTNRALLISVSFAALLMFAGAAGAAKNTLPVPSGLVNDFAGLFEPYVEQRLADKLGDYGRLYNQEIVIVAVDDRPAQRYGEKLFDYWRLGRRGAGPGVLLLVGNEGRSVIVTAESGPRLGDGKKKTITDNLAHDISAGDTAGGIFRAADRLIDALTAIGKPAVTSPYDPPPAARVVVGLFFASMMVVPWVAAVLGRSRRFYAGTATAVFLSALMSILANERIGLLMLGGLGSAGLLFDILITRHFRSRLSEQKKPAWWAGGDWT